MKLIGILQLEDFKRQHADVGSQVDSWIAEAKEAHWQNPHDVTKLYPTASIIKDNQVIFNLRGNRYRLKVQIDYKNKIVLIKNVGTHQEYMRWGKK
jgi:mRNA interferase HigB